MSNMKVSNIAGSQRHQSLIATSWNQDPTSTKYARSECFEELFIWDCVAHEIAEPLLKICWRTT